MKGMVRADLECEHYQVVEEPLSPPAKWISWSTYRPDLLGYRLEKKTEELVIVECETHPNMNRFRSKNFSSLSFQPSEFRTGLIRRILAIPQGRLHGVDLGLRSEWEIWMLGRNRPVEKLAKLTGIVTGESEDWQSAPGTTDKNA
jgi:hypothetical protein